MKLDKVLEGKHNKESFRYNDGFLHMFSRKWDKADIQTLIEVANLLSLEGYTLKKPTGTKTKYTQPLFGRAQPYESKTYEDGTEE